MIDDTRCCNVEVEPSVFQLEGLCVPASAKDVYHSVEACLYNYSFVYVCRKLEAKIMVETRSRYVLVLRLVFFLRVVLAVKRILPRCTGSFYINVLK